MHHNDKKLIWSDDFSVGVFTLDEQHKNLIKLINRLAIISNITVDSEVVSDVLSEMHRYTIEHLNFEEQLLEIFNYPEIEEHKLKHSEFLENIGNFSMDVMNGEKKAPANILKYLNGWLTNHILLEDMKYSQFFKDKEVN